jgi:hypothetical protein
MSGFYWSQSAGVKAVKGLSECQYSNPTLISDTGTIYGVSYGCKNGTNSFFSKPNSGSAVSIWSECTVGAPSLWSAITFLGSGETMGGACNYAAVDDTGSSMIWPLGKQNTSHSYLVGTSSNGVMAGLADNGGPFILSNGTVTYFNKAQNFGGSFVSLESITPSGILVGSFCDSSLESCSGYLLTPSAK